MICLCNPLGLCEIYNHLPAAVGIISSVDMNFVEMECVQVYKNMIQQDAAINMGFFFRAEDGIRDSVASRGLGDLYKRPDFRLVQGIPCPG